MKVLVLHAYSALNAGDGLLVDECLDLLREAFGPVDVTILAHDPASFAGLGVHVVGSKPTWRGYPSGWASTLRAAGRFDLVVAVGGGYLRAGHPLEAAKALLVHGPQLWVASRRGAGVVYLPQSIGPLRLGTRPVVERTLRRIEHVAVRDDRSVQELPRAGVVRAPDMALLGQEWDSRPRPPQGRPVLSVRAVRGRVPEDVTALAARLGEFDGFIQSRTGANDDTAAMTGLRPVTMLDRADLTDPAGPRRVVVAMRLHGALMALRAGHLVVHLAYERKGFGAYADLGLERYVHNTFAFDPARVLAQVEELLRDDAARRDYDDAVARARRNFPAERGRLLAVLRGAAASAGARA